MKAFVENLMYPGYVSLSIKEANDEDHQSCARIKAQTVEEKGFCVQQELVKVPMDNHDDAEESEDDTLTFKGFSDDEVNSNEEGDEEDDEEGDEKDDEEGNEDSNKNDDNNEAGDEEEENE